MSKRSVRSWAYKQMRDPEPPLPGWVVIAIVIGIGVLIALRVIGVL